MWLYGFKCWHCGKEFEAEYTKGKTHKFCSTICYNQERKDNPKGETYVCETCTTPFFVTASRIKQVTQQGNTIRYCSMKCYNKKGKLNPFWGSRHTLETKQKFKDNPDRHHFSEGRANPNYRRFEYTPFKRTNPESAARVLRFEKGACSRCGWKEEPAVLEIHHQDRNRSNNDRSNLEVLCPICHALEHYHAGDGRWRKEKKPRKPPPVVYEDL